MIRVKRAPEPKAFDAQVRQPGLRAIAELCGKRPNPPRPAGKPFKQIAQGERDIPPERYPAYWTKALDDLMGAYDEVCAYSCFRIHPITGVGSTDHFAAKSRDWHKVYEWSNYRLACARLNARKRDFGDVLDPFEVVDGWFQLELTFFQVVPKPRLKAETRRAVEDTIDRLDLNDSQFLRGRGEDAQRYWDRDVSLRVLREESPFVALELKRQGRLNVGDVW